jgi:Fe-S-cluster containining protein
MAIEVLGPLRHTCLLSGGCCQGHFVHVSGEEAARVTALAPALGVDDPIVDGQLRRAGGRCAFLGDDNLCRIHATFGAEAKPIVCRQYPIVAIRVDGDVRIGVDPGCLTGWKTWDSAPELDAGRFVATQRDIDPRFLPIEDAILEMADDLSASEMLRRLLGPQSSSFAADLVRRAQTHRLSDRLRHPDTAPLLRSRLEATADRLSSLNADDLSDLVLDGASDAWVREAVRRVVWLRLVHRAPHPAAGAVLALSGAVLCSYAHDRFDDFAPAFSAWLRVMRAPEVIAIALG